MRFFRENLNSGFSKFVVIIIILSFVIWGFGDALNRDNSWLIKVGNIEYSSKDWQETYKLVTNDPISAKEALHNPKYAKERVFEEMVKNALILQEAKNIGLIVSDAMVKNEIVHMKAFSDDEGKFSGKILEEKLKTNGISENDFLQKMQQQITRNQLMDFFYNAKNIVGKPITDIFAKIMAAEQNIDLYQVNIMDSNIKYSDEDLKKYMLDNQHLFSTPESRDISTITFDKSFVASDVNITDNEVRQKFEKIKDDIEPEKRTAYQIVIPSYKDAVKVLQDIKLKKISYAAAAKIYTKNQMMHYKVGPLPYDEFDPEIAKVVFSLKKGEVSDLVQTPIGWHIFSVAEIIPAKKLKFEDIKDKIYNELLNSKITKKINDLMGKILEEISQGNTIEIIASQYNLKINNFTEKMYRNEDGTVDYSKSNPANTKILEKAFSDDVISIVPSNGNKTFMVLQVNNVTHPQLLKFEDIKQDLIKKYTANINKKYTASVAKSINRKMMKLEGDDSEFNTADDVNKLLTTIKPTKAKFGRITENKTLPVCINNLVMASYNIGEFSGYTSICEEDNKYYFAELKKINFDAINKYPEDQKFMLSNTAQSIFREILFGEFIEHLKTKYKVEVNEKLFQYINE